LVISEMLADKQESFWAKPRFRALIRYDIPLRPFCGIRQNTDRAGVSTGAISVEIC